MSIIDFVRNQIVAFFPRTPLGLRLIHFCMQCGYTGLRVYWFLFRPVTVGVQCLVLCEQQILLIRNTYGRQLWTVPGGGIKPDEQPEDAVRREVAEEVGISLDVVTPLGVFYGREDYRHDCVHGYVAEVKTLTYTIDPGEILEVQWFSLDALPPLAEYAQKTVMLWREQHHAT